MLNSTYSSDDIFTNNIQLFFYFASSLMFSDKLPYANAGENSKKHKPMRRHASQEFCVRRFDFDT